MPPKRIKPEWGAQRIKGLSISKTILHAIKKLRSQKEGVGQKNTETSLIEKFLYPKYGPGQVWEEVARLIKEKGGEIYLRHKVDGLRIKQNKITEIRVKNNETGKQNLKGAIIFFKHAGKRFNPIV